MNKKKISKKNVVLYAVNSDSIYQELVILSIQSLRYYETRIPVVVTVFGKPSVPLRLAAKSLKFLIVETKEINPILSYGLKWLGLKSVTQYTNVLFVDADTIFFGSPQIIFDSCKAKEFYARPESAIYKGEFRGRRFLKARLDRKQVLKLQAEIGLSDKPIFNSSIMLFNRNSHKRVLKRLPQMLILIYDFYSGVRPFPGSNTFIAEEVVGSLFLGLKPVISTSSFPSGLISHFNHWYSNYGGEIGNILHMGNANVLQTLEYFDHAATYLKFEKMFKKKYRSKDFYIRPLSQA